MKNELTCAVVRDLLPVFVEGLTSEETNQAVKQHLAVCPNCTACHRAMAGGEPSTLEADAAEQAREVDYLKKVKRKNGSRVILAIFCTVLLFAAGLALSIFVIGQPVTSAGVAYSMVENGEVLELNLMSTGSANAFKDWKAEIRDGTAYVTGRSVLVSGLYRDGSAKVDVPLAGVSQVYVCDRLMWEDGIPIFLQTLRLYDLKTPYVGDASALNTIASALEIRPHVGDYLNSLHTSSEPYRWTLEFTDFGWQGVWKKNHIEEDMPRYAAQMLALVENLGEVGWTWTDEDGVFHSDILSLEEVNALLPEWTAAYNEANGTDWEPLPSVKDYADSPAALQRLLEISGTY